jgi:hypothetical protein
LTPQVLQNLRVASYVYSVSDLLSRQQHLPLEPCPLFSTGHGTEEEESGQEEHATPVEEDGHDGANKWGDEGKGDGHGERGNNMDTVVIAKDRLYIRREII